MSLVIDDRSDEWFRQVMEAARKASFGESASGPASAGAEGEPERNPGGRGEGPVTL